MNAEFSLTPLTQQDLPFLCNWFNDPQLCQYMDDTEENKIYSPDDLTDMLEDPSVKILKRTSRYYAFRLNSSLIGYASIYDIDPVQKRAEYSILIGAPDAKGKGYGKIIVDLIGCEALKMGLTTLYCTIYENNIASIKSVEKCGFKALKKMPHSEGSMTEWYFEKQL